ncbi:MFS transporter [Micrococcus terreus]|uniref:MFS transporter n=1 Tax=Micrococcus terreus TaxID=574650 RepID=UPI00301A0B0D
MSTPPPDQPGHSDGPGDAAPLPTRPPLGVALASFSSSFDRFAVSPLLVFVALDLGVSLAQAVAVAGVYYLAYGFSQPLWGTLADRFGRVRLLRWALLGAAVAGLLSAVAPTLGLLIAARAVTGVFFGGIIPTALTYIGDTVSGEHRQSALSDLMAGIAVGTALATATAGLVGDLLSWRVMFALPPVLAVVCLLALRSLPEPAREPGGGFLATLSAALRHRWVWAVVSLAFLEGAAVLGMLTFLAPALQDQGLDATAAGLTVAGYGLSTLLSSRLVRPLGRRMPVTGLMLIGGGAMTVGFALVAVHVSVGTVIASALLLGAAWALLHTSLQAWATSVLPAARGTVVALFAAGLFAGSSVSTLAAGPLVADGAWTTLFAAAAVLALVVTVGAILGRRVYDGSAA